MDPVLGFYRGQEIMPMELPHHGSPKWPLKSWRSLGGMMILFLQSRHPLWTYNLCWWELKDWNMVSNWFASHPSIANWGRRGVWWAAMLDAWRSSCGSSSSCIIPWSGDGLAVGPFSSRQLWCLLVWGEKAQGQLVNCDNVKIQPPDIFVELLDTSNKSKSLLINMGIVPFHWWQGPWEISDGYLLSI